MIPERNRLAFAGVLRVVASRILWLAAALALPVAAAAEQVSGGAAGGTAFDPAQALKVSQAAIGRKVGDYAFRDRNGKPVRLADYRGKPLVVNFVYTGCFSACPTTTARIAKAIRAAQRTLGAGTFNVVSIGFNLPYDSPEAMRDFARRFGIDDPHWEFLSPFEQQVDPLLADFGFQYVATPGGFDHVTQTTILDPEGRVFQQVYGEEFALPLFIDPLQRLITGQPMPTQSLGDLLERIRIICTVYDPRAGVYRFKWSVVTSIVAFCLMLFGGIWFLWHEIRKRRRFERMTAERGALSRS
ncbi:MAG: SCO family protein [Burkholderiales bacterium]|nr:SCO family protein [Burkholderiales bacterium]